MQTFRLVQSGKVDRIIAFDELPKRLLRGIEMQRSDGLPRHWRDFVGEVEKYTPPQPDKNPMTGKMEMVGERWEKGPYCYILDYKEVNKDIERWQEISAFVRRAVDMKFRLLDKLEDMALPLAPDAASELKLEPEQMESEGAIIPIPIEFQEKTPAILDKNGKEVRSEIPAEPALTFKCQECEKPFKNERAARMHSFRAHPKKEPV